MPAFVRAPARGECDLRDMSHVTSLLRETEATLVIHLAAVVGGIAANSATPGTFFYDNAIMGIQLLEAARVVGVDKVVIVGTTCAYPKDAPIPFREECLWDGYPEESNASYGLAKRMLVAQATAYRKQYGLNSITVIPTNLYGPGDNFDLDRGHVIPALIRKTADAVKGDVPVVEVWGTGTATRDFLFVRDAAEAIVLAAVRYSSERVLNIGSGKEISIAALARLICRLLKYRGSLVFDPDKPDGQPRRCLDVSAAEKEIGFRSRTELRNGLIETIQWYLRSESAVSRLE